MFCRLLQLSALALAAGLGAAPAGAQGVQGVYVCNDTSDPVAWKVYCGGSSYDPAAPTWTVPTLKPNLEPRPAGAQSWWREPLAATEATPEDLRRAMEYSMRKRGLLPN